MSFQFETHGGSQQRGGMGSLRPNAGQTVVTRDPIETSISDSRAFNAALALGVGIGMLEGDMDKGYVSVGNGISFIHSIKTAREIVDDITKDFDE